MRLRSRALFALCAVTFPWAARAQNASSPTGLAACLANLTANQLAPVIVAVSPRLRDSTERAALPDAGNLTQAIADRARTLLGAPAGTLPAGEPAITWRDLLASLEVTARRAGRLTWRIGSDSALPAGVGDAGARLLGRALDSLLAGGEAYFFWPETLRGDSVIFRIQLVRQWIGGRGASQPASGMPAIPVFRVMAPREMPAVPLRMPAVRYPEASRFVSATGTVILEWVVDTSGRADVATIHAVWPPDRPPLTGELAAYYNAFVKAVREAVVDAQFEPAQIGGCRVRQLVRQPFEFSIRR